MMKKAFTLLELLTVIAIMGILGTAAVGGYQAITRGMGERAALQVAKNIADTARQRANLDRCRTYLFVYDEVQSVDTADEPGRMCGLAIAVKGAGRISAVDGNDWFDEFGDMDQQFLAMEQGGQPLDEKDYAKKSTKFRLFSPRQEDFATVRNGARKELTEEDLEDRETHQTVLFGYHKLDGGASFAVGEEYAKEFAVVRLPEGFTFSGSASTKSASDLGLHKVAVKVIDRNDTSSPTLQVYARRPNGNFDPIGSTSEVKD